MRRSFVNIVSSRTTTAPSPLNLFTTWIVYFIKQCQQHSASKKRPSLVHMMGLHGAGRMSPRSKMGQKWLSKVKKGQVRPTRDVRLSVVHLSPLGSQLSFNSATRIESIVDWDAIRKKYLALTGNEPEKEPEKDDKEDDEDNDQRNNPNSTGNGNNAFGASSGGQSNNSPI